MFLVLALLVSAPVFADIHIKSKVVHTIKESSTQNRIQTSDFGLDFNITDNRHAKLSISDDCEIVYTIIADDGKDVVFAIELFAKNDKGEFRLVIKGVYSLAPGREAYARFGRKDAAGKILEDRLITFVVCRDVVSVAAADFTNIDCASNAITTDCPVASKEASREACEEIKHQETVCEAAP